MLTFMNKDIFILKIVIVFNCRINNACKMKSNFMERL
jgi:hypothetical protein